MKIPPSPDVVLAWYADRFGFPSEPADDYTAEDVAYAAYYIDLIRVSSLNN